MGVQGPVRRGTIVVSGGGSQGLRHGCASSAPSRQLRACVLGHPIIASPECRGEGQGANLQDGFRPTPAWVQLLERLHNASGPAAAPSRRLQAHLKPTSRPHFSAPPPDATHQDPPPLDRRPAALRGRFPGGRAHRDPDGVGAASSITPLYPDLRALTPTNKMFISHPATSQLFSYTHIIYNAGPGPLELRPTYYRATDTADAVQRLYGRVRFGNLVPAQDVPIQGKFFWHAPHNHYHFPAADFGLYTLTADGGVGAVVAMSPKLGFCIADSHPVDPTVSGYSSTKGYSGGACQDPTAPVGISPGWVTSTPPTTSASPSTSRRCPTASTRSRAGSTPTSTSATATAPTTTAW